MLNVDVIRLDTPLERRPIDDYPAVAATRSKTLSAFATARQEAILPVVEPLVLFLQVLELFLTEIVHSLGVDLSSEIPNLFGDEFIKGSHQRAVVRSHSAKHHVVRFQR